MQPPSVPEIASWIAPLTPPGLPVSLLFVGMLYTGTKSLKYLSVPVYTIFKNLTIIVIAYGEVLWFGGRVSPLALLSFGLMVFSSVVAAWADIQSAIEGFGHSGDSVAAVTMLNVGYMWMGLNVICTSARLLVMKKVIKQTNDWDSRSPERPAERFNSDIWQPCTTAISSPYPSSSSAPSYSRTGPDPISPRTSLRSRAIVSSLA